MVCVADFGVSCYHGHEVFLQREGGYLVKGSERWERGVEEVGEAEHAFCVRDGG